MTWRDHIKSVFGYNTILETAWKGKVNMEFPNVVINPATQRVVVTSAGVPEVADIPAEVLALRNIRKTLARVAAAVDLASKGHIVDVWQDAYYASNVAGDTVAYELLQERRRAGYTWVVALLRHAVTSVGPGIAFPGDVPYDAEHPPAGAILVAPIGHAYGDPGILEPVQPPKPEPQPVSPIGPPAGGSRYLFNPLSDDDTPDGGTYTENGVNYLKVMRPGFAGILTKWWEKQS